MTKTKETFMHGIPRSQQLSEVKTIKVNIIMFSVKIWSLSNIFQSYFSVLSNNCYPGYCQSLLFYTRMREHAHTHIINCDFPEPPMATHLTWSFEHVYKSTRHLVPDLLVTWAVWSGDWTQMLNLYHRMNMF